MSMKRTGIFRCSLGVSLSLGALVAPPVRGHQGSSGASGGPDVFLENTRVRAKWVSVEPGASLPSGADRVLVYFTAGPDGRMPAEAVWQPAQMAADQNRGRVRLEALAIEMKDVPQRAAHGTPPESLAADGVRVATLIDNARVLVLKHRYEPGTIGTPVHLHAEDVLVVYLRGGYTWPPLSGSWGAVRVRQRDVDLVPANTFHTLANAGNDPLELLVIIPK